MTTNNFNNKNNERNDKKTFEGITKMNKTFNKFNSREGRQEENKDNSHFRTEKDRMSRSFYDNRNNNMNKSHSPITHKRNDHIQSHKELETKFEAKDTNNQDANLPYFEDFNVKKF